jgi:mono/diheme cytochrome c family protein
MANAAHKLNRARLARFAWLPLCLFLAACHVDMYDQARYDTNQPSEFFEDGRAVRPPVPNTVSMGSYNPESPLTTGEVNGELAVELPPELELNAELLTRGQTVFNTYCAPCHGLTGDGNGVIAYRGGFAVPSFHNARLREVPLGYFFDVITNGVGRMYNYGSRIPAEDRWAAAAYVRALQLSQNATAADLSDEDRAQLEAGQ